MFYFSALRRDRPARIPTVSSGTKEERVSAGCLGVIDPFWWNELGQPVAHADFPVGLVHHPMMRPTQHHQIVELCFTMMHPVHNMMHLAGTRRPITPRMRTTTIPNRNRPPLR
jgi:hypothetical protein